MIKVLVAEDEVTTRMLVEFKLKQQGYEVLLCEDGETALRLAALERPSLIVMDVMMPVMDGFQVLRRLKELPELRHIPVILLTAKGKDRDVVTGLELGAADYMVKPFSPSEFLARVRKIHRLWIPDPTMDGARGAGAGQCDPG